MGFLELQNKKEGVCPSCFGTCLHSTFAPMIRALFQHKLCGVKAVVSEVFDCSLPHWEGGPGLFMKALSD